MAGGRLVLWVFCDVTLADVVVGVRGRAVWGCGVRIGSRRLAGVGVCRRVVVIVGRLVRWWAPMGAAGVVTVPNVLSLARLLGVPVFLWLVLWPVFGGPTHDLVALLVLALSGVTDYLDGYLARRLDQITKLGAVLDQFADRLYVLSTLVGLAARGIIPWWLMGVLVGRDVCLLWVPPLLRRHGFGNSLPSHVVGKAATFSLMYAFPLLLLSTTGGWLGTVAAVAGWAFAGWGTAMYWLAAVLYVVQVRRIVVADRLVAAADGKSVDGRSGGLGAD